MVKRMECDYLCGFPGLKWKPRLGVLFVLMPVSVGKGFSVFYETQCVSGEDGESREISLVHTLGSVVLSTSLFSSSERIHKA